MKNIERKPKYAMRKLSVGLVSCMLGFALIAGPSQSLAAGGAETEEPATKVEEDAEAPVSSNDLENDDSGNDADLLELNDKATPEAVNQQQTELKYQIGWKTYDDSPKNQFDENKYKNDKIKLKYQLVYEYVDNAGNTHEIVDDQFTEQEFEVGKTQDIVVDRNEVETRLKAKNPNIKELTKVNDMMLTTLGNETNPYWGAGKTGTNEGYTRFNIQQNMNTHMTYDKEDGALILDEDKDNLNLKHSVKKTYKGNEDWATSNDSKPIYGKDKFEEGKSKYLAQKDSRLSYATRNNSLGMYSAYTGKYKTYRFVTEFDGKDKDRLSKYYNLKIEGNDLEGWTVTLGSNLKQREIEKEQTKEYDTIYEYDPNLAEGEEQLISEGQDGIVGLKFNQIYLEGKNGGVDKIVKEIDLKKSRKIQNLVNRIIRIGTKTKTPDSPILPGSPDTEIPDDQGDLTPDEREEFEKLIKDLIDEMNKEENQETKPEDKEKPADKEEVKPSENEEETKKPQKEDKKEEDKKKPGKKETIAPAKAKKADQKSSKDASPKTGVTGSASILALLGSSLLASFGLRKKND